MVHSKRPCVCVCAVDSCVVTNRPGWESRAGPHNERHTQIRHRVRQKALDFICEFPNTPGEMFSQKIKAERFTANTIC